MLEQGVGAGGQAIDRKQLPPIGIHTAGKQGVVGFMQGVAGEDVAPPGSVVNGGDVCVILIQLQAEGIGAIVLRRVIYGFLVEERPRDRDAIAWFRS